MTATRMPATSSSSVLVVAEKPSVARDIAAVLGANVRGEGHFHGSGWIVTWAIGHLAALAEPHEMRPEWKRWRIDDLPLLPTSWPLVVSAGTRDQFAIVKRLLRSKDVRGVVSATDAGREGELIFRYIYEAAGATKPVRRLWISSLTADAIRAGFRSLRDGKDFDRLADAARGRSRADWLVGMNLSRLYSIQHDGHLSVGRVQTPTLAMIVERELEIRAFVPEDYVEVVATFATADGTETNGKPASYEGTYVRPGAREARLRGDQAGAHPTRLPADGAEAQAIIERAKRGVARIESVDRQTRRIPPPQLYDLTELQRHANRLYGFTAERTLTIAQALYEKRKLISYPRTDSRHVSSAAEATFPTLVASAASLYSAELIAAGTGTRRLGRRFVDDARVSDHHAILPTETKPPAELPSDERKIYDLVCRRFLSAWHDDHVFAVTTVITTIVTDDVVDPYTSSGTTIEAEGWKVLDIRLSLTPKPGGSEDREPRLPSGLAKGMPRRVIDAKAMTKRTRPPSRLNDATLLTAMETAGQTLDERELSDAMRERGLGTPATRAAILETLLRREYVVRDGKSLVPTEKGISLVSVVDTRVKSPAMTGEWEARLARIERGTEDLDTFMQAIETYVREVVTGGSSPPPRVPAEREPRVERSRNVDELLRVVFGFPSFRPHQREVCAAAVEGRDVLLVMPTGAGKSLCYQLPGIARDGTTLVVSPLIALMEDQVARLVERGLAADRIHSSRSRADSRAACRAYLDGELDFLFIAPERLKVPGFPEMLARRKPALIAIDEAHCISQWGHDFRPDYRMLGARLPLLRPSPVIALTATATPSVQDDIVAELRLEAPLRSIHGFRRTNIAIEVVERKPQERAGIVRTILDDRPRRPAIVYAPTRAESERLAAELARLGAAAYHAGMDASTRDSVQARFLAGELDVIIATTAFGMGIDKADVRTVIHTALPASVEGYYQEIGRAGRDGKPSRAILLHSFADTRTHEFFLERDYPSADVLAQIEDALAKTTAKRAESDVATLAKRSRVAAETFEKALEKLWIHGAVLVGADDTVSRGPRAGTWRDAYEAQRAHKRDQLARMRRYADTPACRMLQLVEHFGDERDSALACGICDVCASALSIAQKFRAPTAPERTAAVAILATLGERDGRAVGQLHRELFESEGTMDRRVLESVIAALVRSGALRITHDTFDKEGQAIVFQRVWLGASAAPVDLAALRIVEAPDAPTTAAKPGKRPKRSRRRAAKEPKRTKGASSRAGAPIPLELALRAWRTAEAKKRGLPAFRVLTDASLLGIVASRPTSEAALLGVSGVGMSHVRSYGKALLDLVARTV
jgi:DNA topoisomerase-3